MSAAYDTGTRAVAVVLGAAAALVLLLAGHLAAGIDRAQTPAILIAILAIVSLALAGLAAVLPGVWRLVGLALAALPLLWVLAAVARAA